MVAPLYQFYVKDGGTVRDDWLRTVRNGLINRGVSAPNVTPGSDYYVMASGFGGEAAVAMANCAIMSDQLMPDTAILAYLDRQGSNVGLTRRSSGGSTGVSTFSASTTSLVTTGAQLFDQNGLRYQVALGGTYNNGDTIPLAAVDTGFATNLAVGTSLRWLSPPPFASTTVIISGAGLANGTDAEDDESFRNRILARMQTFPAGGNWQYVANVGDTSAPSVQKTFVYPAIQGPSTVHLAVCAAPTATNKNRDVALATLNGVVIPYASGQVPEHAFTVITTVANTPVDIALGLALPAAPTSPVPGPGGGWLDGTPWPQSTSSLVTLTSVTSSTSFVVNAIAAPVSGVSRIAWLSPLTWTLYTALVIGTPTGSAGAWGITIDTPFPGIAVGNAIFPQSQNQSTYVASLLQWFALLGPGEKTTNPSALIRGYRHPLPQNSWPYAIGPSLLKALANAGTEVLDAQHYYRTDGTTTIAGNAGQLTPQVPATVSNAPLIYTPRNIALYPI